MFNGLECRLWINKCSPSPVLETSPYEWKILRWDKKSNKQTKQQTYVALREVNWKWPFLNIYFHWTFQSYPLTEVTLYSSWVLDNFSTMDAFFKTQHENLKSWQETLIFLVCKVLTNIHVANIIFLFQFELFAKGNGYK